MSDKLKYEQDGHVVTLTLNQPETMNAITDPDMVEAMVQTMTRLTEDNSVRCAIITGAGKAFSSGGNLKHMADKAGLFAGDAITAKDGYKAGIQRMAKAVWECEVPLIAAVNGAAFGAGCDLTCMCDIRYASTKAIFAENFVRVGIIPGDGGAWFLPRQIGLSRAAEMTFTAEPIRAPQALEWGLVAEVLPPDALLPRARDLAAMVAETDARTAGTIRRLINDGADMPLPEALAREAAAHKAHLEALDKADVARGRDRVLSGNGESK